MIRISSAIFLKDVHLRYLDKTKIQTDIQHENEMWLEFKSLF